MYLRLIKLRYFEGEICDLSKLGFGVLQVQGKIDDDFLPVFLDQWYSIHLQSVNNGSDELCNHDSASTYRNRGLNKACFEQFQWKKRENIELFMILLNGNLLHSTAPTKMIVVLLFLKFVFLETAWFPSKIDFPFSE